MPRSGMPHDLIPVPRAMLDGEASWLGTGVGRVRGLAHELTIFLSYTLSASICA